MPYCPQCGADNPAAARFCDQCGAALIPVPAQAAAPSAVTVVPGTPVVATPASAASAPSAGPNTCPQCGMSVIPGEAFCDTAARHCCPRNAERSSAVFAPVVGVPQQPTYPAPQQVQPVPVAPSYTPPPPVAPVYTPPTTVAPVYTPPPPATPAYTPALS